MNLFEADFSVTYFKLSGAIICFHAFPINSSGYRKVPIIYYMRT